MRLTRNLCLVGVVLALVGAFGVDTGAQAPAPTWRAISATGIRVDWPAVPGARYDVLVTSHGFVSPSPLNEPFFQIDPLPPGNYVVQIRVNGTNIVSAPVAINWGGGSSCLPMSAPTIGSTVSGNNVTITWGAVPGAIGYRLQVGNAPGVTLFSQDFNAQTFAFSGPIPVLGTFYARVMAGNGCGETLASTPDHSFVVGAATPGPSNPGGSAGNRTPDPTASNGGVLCVPGRPDLGLCIPYTILGYADAVARSVAARFPGDLSNSCGNMTFVFRVLSELRARDTRWGLNYKRGHAPVLSPDIIAFNPTNRPDDNEAQVYLFDLIGNHCPESGGPSAGVDIVHGYQSTVNDTWLAALSGRFPAGTFGTPFGARWTIDAYRRAGFTN